MPKLTGAKPVPGERPYKPSPRIIGRNIEKAANEMGYGMSVQEENFAKAAEELARGIRSVPRWSKLICDDEGE